MCVSVWEGRKKKRERAENEFEAEHQLMTLNISIMKYDARPNQFSESKIKKRRNKKKEFFKNFRREDKRRD